MAVAVENVEEERKKHFFLSGTTVAGDLKYPSEPARFHRRDVEKFFVWASEQGASDITIQTGEQIFLEIDGRMLRVTKHFLDHSEVMEMVVAMYGSETAKAILSGNKDLDFPYQINPDRDTKYRYRVNCVGVTVNGGDGCQVTARTIPGVPPALSQLGLETEILANIVPKQGMIVIAGGTGSGKSTLLASVIRHLLEDPDGHRKIITFESPIEYVYDDVANPTTSIAQTEVGKNLTTFVEGTRNALRRKPTIILLGEARDAETIGEAVTASMTGHLLYTTVHANGFADTIRRMVNVFNEEKNSRAVDIVSSLRMVICQRLVPATNGKRVALREFIVMNEEIVDFILDSGVDHITASCRKILKKYGQSFLEDATRKYKDNQISYKVWKEIARLSKGEDLDADEIIRQAKMKGDKLSGSLSIDDMALQTGVAQAAPFLSEETVSPTLHAQPLTKPKDSPTFGSDLSTPDWPEDEPPLTLT